MSRKKSERIVRSKCCGVAIHWINAQDVKCLLRKSMLPYMMECFYICSGCGMSPCEIQDPKIRRKEGCENPH